MTLDTHKILRLRGAGLSLTEIAARLGMTRGAVSSALYSYRRTRRSEKAGHHVFVQFRIGDSLLAEIEDVQGEFGVTKSDAVRFLLEWGAEYLHQVKNAP